MAPPPVLANVPLTAAPQNYREKYCAEIDVTSGQYTALLAAQDPESPVQPAAMLQSVLMSSSDNVPKKAFLVIIPGEGNASGMPSESEHSTQYPCIAPVPLR
jgi:hypothetical protein